MHRDEKLCCNLFHLFGSHKLAYICLSTYRKLLSPKQPKFRVMGLFLFDSNSDVIKNVSFQNAIMYISFKEFCLFIKNASNGPKGTMVDYFCDQEEHQMCLSMYPHAFINTSPSFLLTLMAIFYRFFYKVC